jgi:hypothetical protein
MTENIKLIVLCTAFVIKQHTEQIFIKFLNFLQSKVDEEEYRIQVPPKKRQKVKITTKINLIEYKARIRLIRSIIANDDFDYSHVSSKDIILLQGIKRIINNKLQIHFSKNLLSLINHVEVLKKYQNTSIIHIPVKDEIESTNRHIIYLKNLIKSLNSLDV